MKCKNTRSSGTTLGVAAVILSYSMRRTRSGRYTACERSCSVTIRPGQL